MSLADGLSILFIFSKNQLLALLIFAMVSFVSFAFISALIFKISLLLLTLGFFISSFLVALGVELGYLFDFFLVSWGKPVLLWTFPLALLLQCPRHGTTDWFQTGKGVGQGCILSPCLFNLYAEYIIRNAGLHEAQAGIKIWSRSLCCCHLYFNTGRVITAVVFSSLEL